MECFEGKDHLPDFISKMEAEGLSPLTRETFAYYYKQILTGITGLISDNDIQPIQPGEIEHADNLSAYKQAGNRVLKNAVRIFLNGGLGTSMGLTGPKSLIEAKGGKSFLEIILRRIEKSNITMALLNSFNTDEETRVALSKLKPNKYPLMLLQNKFPKILQKNYAPATWPQNPKLEWNPPGHGDLFSVLYESGALQNFLKEGIQYALISNSDNLGANMDESLLGYFAENQFPFMIEVAEKTPADVKGGHIARDKEGRLVLREVAQCPDDELDVFQDIQRYRYFNTNNVWINLKSLKMHLDSKKIIYLPLIRNPKTLDPRDKNSPPVFQIETAMGAALSLFEGAAAVSVPRSRFFPVKTCNDLMASRSDFFVHTQKYKQIINPDRIAAGYPETIKIDLDPQFFSKVDDLDERFPQGFPSLVHCESLIIEGDVRFERNVIIKGAVCIKNVQKSQAVIKEGTVIDRDLVFLNSSSRQADTASNKK